MFLVETFAVQVVLPELQLYVLNTTMRHRGGRGVEQSRTDFEGAFLGEHKEFIDLGHQSAVFQTEEIDSEQITDGSVAFLRDPDLAAIGRVEKIGE